MGRGHAVRRAGAKIGDTIYVTGKLGSSALGLEALKAGKPSDPSVKRHLFPQARHRIGVAVAGQAHAMIDVSDGLSTDLGHILDESHVSARIYKDRLPIWPGAGLDHALHGGEEYELVIVGNDLSKTIEGVSVTPIGEIVKPGNQPQLFLVDGNTESILTPRGWQHFKDE